MKKIQTLCLVHRSPEILLAMKKRGFGAGRWNGLGGKLAEGESIEEAARREVSEEANIEIGPMDKVGILEFCFHGQPDALEVHVFRATDFGGEPTETEEMRPQWFAESELPFDDMWPDDRHWMPLFLAGKMFTGKFSFGEDGGLSSHELNETDVLPEA